MHICRFSSRAHPQLALCDILARSTKLWHHVARRSSHQPVSTDYERLLVLARVDHGCRKRPICSLTRDLQVLSHTAHHAIDATQMKLYLLLAAAHALKAPTRRSLLAATGAALVAPLTGEPAVAANDELVDVYFGCGCFWHVQHEFVEAERKILGRKDKELTSRAGYAGGNNGKLQPCYHNLQGKNDYGKLGHAEVVGMKIPASKYEDFAREYFKLLGPDGSRPDQFGDRGPEYRNLIGVPGGKESPFVQSLLSATKKEGDKVDFAKGKGNDADLKALVWIMDTNDHPFWRGENYHQFHDGFARGENYPDAYNSLRDGLQGDTACPSF